MKRKKIITILIIINLILLGTIFNFIKKENVHNKNKIIKEMTEAEYEDNLRSLNTSHKDYVEYVEESKKKIASAITDMGIDTPENADASTMSSNIRSLPGASNANKVSYDNTNSGLTSTNVQGAVDELDNDIDNLNNTSVKFPDYNNAISLENNIISYTAPQDGYIRTILETSGATNVTYTNNVRINNIVVAQLSVHSPAGVIQSFLFPISKGETANWFYESASGKSYNNIFIPFK